MNANERGWQGALAGMQVQYVERADWSDWSDRSDPSDLFEHKPK